MVFGDAVIANGLSVRSRRIPRIAVPSILWVKPVQFFHELVSVCFGQNTGCGDVQETTIALYFGFVGYRSPGLETIAIHGDEIG